MFNPTWWNDLSFRRYSSFVATWFKIMCHKFMVNAYFVKHWNELFISKKFILNLSNVVTFDILFEIGLFVTRLILNPTFLAASSKAFFIAEPSHLSIFTGLSSAFHWNHKNMMDLYNDDKSLFFHTPEWGFSSNLRHVC